METVNTEVSEVAEEPTATVDPAAPAESATAKDDNSDSSTENGDSPEARKAILKRFDELEGKRKPEAKQDSPPAKTDKPDAAPVVESGQDEPVKPEAGTEADEADNRPEWNKVMNLVPKEARKEARAAMEKAITKQLQQFRPATVIADRIRKAVGDEGIENTVRLVEGWKNGDESAEKMLEELLADVKARRGSVLTSGDLVKESKDLDTQLQEGAIDETAAQKRRRELLELERSRAGQKQTEAQRQEAARVAGEARVERLVSERTTAINNWEAGVAESDPDYARLQPFIIDRARREADDMQIEKGELLSPAEMVALMKKTYSAIKTEMTGMLPKKAAIKPVNGGGSSVNSRPAPKNERERLLQKFDELEAKGRR